MAAGSRARRKCGAARTWPPSAGAHSASLMPTAKRPSGRHAMAAAAAAAGPAPVSAEAMRGGGEREGAQGGGRRTNGRRVADSLRVSAAAAGRTTASASLCARSGDAQQGRRGYASGGRPAKNARARLAGRAPTCVADCRRTRRFTKRWQRCWRAGSAGGSCATAAQRRRSTGRHCPMMRHQGEWCAGQQLVMRPCTCANHNAGSAGHGRSRDAGASPRKLAARPLLGSVSVERRQRGSGAGDTAGLPQPRCLLH